MYRFFSFKRAFQISLTLYSIFFIFHLLVMVGVIPQEIVWGGRVESREELIGFEMVSITILLIALTLTLLRAKYLHHPKFAKITQYTMWFLFALFVLNTIGNLLAVDLMETLLFTPVTLLLAVSTWRLAQEP